MSTVSSASEGRGSRRTRARWRESSGLLGCLVLLAACREIPTVPERPTPVVSLTLVEGESLQVAVVTVGTAADSTIPRQGVPVPAGSVSLRVEDDSGNVWPFAAAAAEGRFSARMSPRRGSRYRLLGTVMGRALSAETRVPAQFAVAAPAGDTMTAADTVPCQFPSVFEYVCVQAVLLFDRSGAVSYLVLDQVGPFREGGRLLGTTAELRFFRADRTRDVLFVAYNGDAAAWLTVSTARGNVTGAFGGFGAALVVRRNIYIP